MGNSNSNSNSNSNKETTQDYQPSTTPPSLAAAESNASNGSGNYSTNDNGSTSNGGSSDVVIRQTEGWLELFLTPPEKYRFSQWSEKVNDKSVLHKWVTSPMVVWLQSRVVPENMSPNVISLAGLVLLLQAWYFTSQHAVQYPVFCTIFASFNIASFFVTHSLDTYHADQIHQRTTLGDLFKYNCDLTSTIFFTILTTHCLGGASDLEVQWYAVQISQLVLFYKHLSAFHRHAGLRYHVLSGPAEVLLLSLCMLCLRAIFGLDAIHTIYTTTMTSIYNALSINGQILQMKDLICSAYYGVYGLAVAKCLLLDGSDHGWSRIGLSASLLMRLLPALFIQIGIPQFKSGQMDVICDGLFMAVLTSDVALAKMADREVHPLVVVMSLTGVLSHSIIFTLCMAYYIAVFADLCSFLNMPLFTTCRNVYCDGVYDLCHIGHKMLFQNALQYGNRLYVGVVGDKDAQNYKRPPIMSHDERCAEVEGCKAVTKVIRNAPCFGLTREFLELHQIHVVAFGQEYLDRYPDPKDDPYYRVPRELGIAKPLPRTKGLSTSDLIRRIQQAQSADEKKSPT